MAFGAIEITTITRAQDYSPIKQNEDYKGMVDQNNIGQHIQKDIQQRAREVRSGDNSEWQNRKFDAKDKGSNEYRGNGGHSKKRAPQDGQVVVNGHQGIDIKI